MKGIRAGRVAGLAAAAWAWAAGGLAAAELPVEAVVNAVAETAETKQINDAKYGLGKEETKTWHFTAKLKATGFDPLDHLSLKLYVIQIKNWAQQMDQYKEESVAKVLDKDDVTVSDGGTEIDLGDVDIHAMNSDGGSVKWFGGFKYAGYVLEIYRDGELCNVKVSGGAPLRKAYEDFKKAPPAS